MNITLAKKIAEFEPTDGNWLELESMFEEVFSSTEEKCYYVAIFNLFERFAEDDGAGVFWSAVHGMETRGDYEEELVRFFRRHPTEMTRTMLQRIRNSGAKSVAGISIDTLIP